MSPADEINPALEAAAPTLFAALSDLGRRAAFPQDIPFQAREARDTEINSTIGVLTDGHRHALPLPSMEKTLRLPAEDRDRAWLYSPVDGFLEMRRRWRDWQRRDVAASVPSTRPIVTVGLTHGLSLAADLFTEAGTTVVVPEPFWGNYRQVFGFRRGALIQPAPSFHDGRFDPRASASALAALPPDEPALVILNFPANPGGYSPTVDERRELRDSLLTEADRRPLVVLCDDAYSGLVFEDDVPAASMFWELAGVHPRLTAIKVDGVTKELAFFGGRLGFLTFGLDLGDAAAAALDSKVKCLTRATVGSPVAMAQMIVLQALRDGAAERETAAVLDIARGRYAALRAALADLDGRLLRPMPCNSGYFALLEMAPESGVDAAALRRHLIAQHSAGVVSVGSRYIRLATCSVAAEDIAELVARVQRGAEELARSE